MAVYYINGTSNSGATFGTSGYFYPLYLTATEANSAVDNITGTSHPHTFEEAPNITFYMPVEDAKEAQLTAPSGSYSGEVYISYTSPIAEIDVEEIGTGVLAGDTFNSWRKKTNDVARETIANKATVGSVDTRLTRLLSVTGGENNIMTLTSSDDITGEKDFRGIVKFTAADDLANAVQVGTDGKLYVSGSTFFLDKNVDLHTAGAEIKASNFDVPTGKTKYAGIQYTWPTTPPIAGQILKVGSGNTLSWATEAAAEASVEAFLIEDPNPIGSILQWSTNSAPSKWLICDGSAVSRTTYDDLFAVIGETYGNGDGSTTFNVPDLRARVPVGKGTNVDGNNLSAAFETLGATSYVINAETLNGEYETTITHTITNEEMPPHRHWLPIDGGGNAGAGYYGITQGGQAHTSVAAQSTHQRSTYYAGGASNDSGDSSNGTQSTTKGSNDPMSIPAQNVQPFIVLNYIIKAQGSTVVEQNVTPSNGILINDAAAQTNLLAAGSVNTIKMDVDTNDFEFNGNTLKLVDTNYRSGEVIETFSGPCGIFTNASGTPTDADTHTRTVLSGTYRMPSCGASNSTNMLSRILSDVGEIFGGVSYKRIAGVKYIYYAFAYNAKPSDNHGIWSHTPVVDSRAANLHVADNTDIAGTGGSATASRSYESGVHVFQNQQNNFEVITVNHDTKLFINEFTVECVDTLEEENIALSKVYWPVGSTYQLSSMIRNEHGTDNEAYIFASQHNRNTTPGTVRFNSPHLTITATAG